MPKQAYTIAELRRMRERGAAGERFTYEPDRIWPTIDLLLRCLDESVERTETFRASAVVGWESAKCLAISPPPFSAPATEREALKALALLATPLGELGKKSEG